MTFGIKTSQAGVAYNRIVDIWTEADGLESFDHAWLWDHVVPLRGPVTGPALEAWTLLAALAAQTSRLQLGVIVTDNRLRPPAVLAKMAATVDIISGGRLVFGIGAGGSRVQDPDALALVERELGAAGVPVVSTGEAVGALGEACAIVRRLWTEDEPFDHDGRWYTLRGAICEPKPVRRPYPPILIGAAGRRSLRITAEHADIWNCPYGGNLDEFRRLNGLLDAECRELGRDPATIQRSVQLLVTAEPGAAGAPTLPGRSDAPTTRELIPRLVDAGANHIVLGPAVGDMEHPAGWLADEVVEPVKRVLGIG